MDQEKTSQAMVTAPEAAAPLSTWQQVRRVLVFQLKLIADAGRDFILSPLSFIALLLDLLRGDGKTRYFDELLSHGRKSDEIINLFDAHKPKDSKDLDQFFDKVEHTLVSEYQESELSTTAKKHFEQTLTSIKKLKADLKNRADKPSI